jgi:hypothetical protein
MFVNRAKSSGVGNLVRSMMMISLKGSYLIVTAFSFSMCFGFSVCLWVSFTALGLNQVFVIMKNVKKQWVSLTLTFVR